MKPKRNYAGSVYTPSGMDACQTPPYALYPLLPYIRPTWQPIWEPACGKNNLVNALRFRGYQVIATDILYGKNFFNWKPDFMHSCVITNPPYSIKYDWLERCYELDTAFALLLPVETLGAKSAQKLFDKYGIEIIFFTPRINFEMPNKGYSGHGAQFPTAWFTWRFHLGSQMVFTEIPREVIKNGFTNPPEDVCFAKQFSALPNYPT